MMPASLQALASALVHTLWQGALVGALAWAADRALRQRSAALRFAVLHACLWALVIAFAWTWSLAWLRLSSPRAALGDAALPLGPGSGAAAWWVLAAWAAGAGAYGSRLALGVVGVARWRRRAVAAAPAWSRLLHELALAMRVPSRLRARLQLRALAGLDSPVVFGVLQPLVLVPLSWATGVPTAAMRAALAHELAHVLRHDYLLQLLHGAIEASFFYHPAVRWLCARLRVEREHCCDELAIASSFDPLEYARGLVELEGARALPSPALAATGASLMSRIDRIVRASAKPRRKPPAAAALTACVGVALALLPAAVVPACVAAGDDAEATARPEPTAPRATTTTAPTLARAHAPTIAVPWLAEPLAVHAAAIDAAARRHGVDPSLLAIVTWVESRGDAHARSPMGARGLMQLMPRTADAIARERGLADHDVERLDDAAYNLDLGAYHLAALIEEYGAGDELDADVIAIAAAAYNGGRRRADAWLSGAALPEETAQYKDRVVALWQARDEPRPPTR